MTTRSIPAIAVPAPARAGSLWATFLSGVLAASRAVGTRRTLLEMDARMLKDIGITHAQAVAEARRMPWDLAAPRR
jgi:uncharacterized protein YjiS (DUF1127 family)